MYTRLIQAHEAMDPELKAASAYAAKQLRLMVTNSTYKEHYCESIFAYGLHKFLGSLLYYCISGGTFLILLINVKVGFYPRSVQIES
jgi:hypothetical protein